MSEYTPTTGEVKNGFIEFENAFRDLDEVESGFNRWFADVKEDIWDKAINEAEACGWLHDLAHKEMIMRNPYRGRDKK